MSVINRSRRQFLVGTGGTLMAIPFLESLLPNRAAAQAYSPQPRFVAFATGHGGAWERNMYPAQAALTETKQHYSDHVVRRGNLVPKVDGGKASLSPILSAPSSLFTPALAAKMNVIAGLDIPFYINHHTGGHLGNFARCDTETSDSSFVSKVGGYTPTIDQVMAWSKSFYKDLGANRLRSMHIGGGKGLSWDHSNAQARSGNIQAVPSAASSRALFEQIFVQQAAATPVAMRTPVVDRVRESYERLRNGNFGDARRLSAEDKRRLDDHLTRISELDRRTKAVASASCGSVQAPSASVTDDLYRRYTNLESSTQFHKVFNDVVVAAFMCGTSRIAIINADLQWSSYAGDWHQDVAHQANQADGNKQNIVTQSYQVFFERAFLDLISKLDVEEANGKTYLDNTLVQWTQESGLETHDGRTLPVVTAGSAAGFLKTGSFIDYRNREFQMPQGWTMPPQYGLIRPGLLYNQYLGTVLQAMGVPPSEYERNGLKGYGSQFMNPDWGAEAKRQYPDRLRADASAVLPFLKA
jgi:hypothetical protein